MKPASFSIITNYERCPHTRWHHLRDSPQAPSGAAADEGNARHKEAELYLTGRGPLPEWPHFKEELHALRQMAVKNDPPVAVEQLWAFNSSWQIVPYAQAWVVIKADVAVPALGFAYDWKTGKDSPVSHGFQAGLYAVGVANVANLSGAKVTINMAYLKTGKIKPYTFNEARFASTQASWTRRINKMWIDDQLLPKPSPANCKYCNYRRVCEYSVRPDD